MTNGSMVEALRTAVYKLRENNVEPKEHRLTRVQFDQLKTEIGKHCCYEIESTGVVKFEGVPIVIDDRCSRG